MKKVLENSEEASTLVEESVMNVKTVAACNGQQTMLEVGSNVSYHLMDMLSEIQRDIESWVEGEGETLLHQWIL